MSLVFMTLPAQPDLAFANPSAAPSSTDANNSGNILGPDICALLRQGAAQYPAATAVIHQNHAYSYLTLAVAAHHLQLQFAAQGIQRGMLVGITLPPSPVFLATIFALAAIGACALPLSPSRDPNQRIELANKFGIHRLVVNQHEQALEGWPALVLDNLHLDEQDLLSYQQSSSLVPDASLADAAWFVVLSSGTTSNQKGVALTQTQSLTRIGQSALIWDRHTRTIPFEMSMGAGLFPALRTLAHGGTLLLMENADFDNNFADYVNRHQATHILLSPWMAAQLVQQLQGRKLAMPSLRYLWLGGGHCPQDVLSSLLERATPNVWVKYASVETGVIAAASASEALRTPGLSGKLGAWVEARTQQEDGTVLAAGQPGLLSFRSIGWPSRYQADADNASGSFSNGWYCTQDYGRLGPDGSVYVEGRAQGALNLGGIRIQPEFLEDAIAKQLKIIDCAAVDLRLTDGRSEIVIAVTAADASKSAHILALLAQELAASPLISKRVAVVPKILRSGMGKVARQQMRLALESA
jgi:acyl-CoA synthetase (AMP-forming)/AMP-acid ligase II